VGGTSDNRVGPRKGCAVRPTFNQGPTRKDGGSFSYPSYTVGGRNFCSSSVPLRQFERRKVEGRGSRLVVCKNSGAKWTSGEVRAGKKKRKNLLRGGAVGCIVARTELMGDWVRGGFRVGLWVGGDMQNREKQGLHNQVPISLGKVVKDDRKKAKGPDKDCWNAPGEAGGTVDFVPEHEEKRREHETKFRRCFSGRKRCMNKHHREHRLKRGGEKKATRTSAGRKLIDWLYYGGEKEG